MSIRIAAIAALVPITLAGCTVEQGQHANANALTPRQMQLLNRELGGKVAGQPIACLPVGSGSADTVRVSDSILLYRVSGRLVYKNELRGPCPGLSRDSDVIVSVISGPGPCSGDIIRLVDRGTGMQGASCALGDFVPYRTPERR